MRTTSTNKALVGCLILMLMFSSIFVFQSTSASKAEITIWGRIVDTSDEPLANVTIVLYDLHTNVSTSVNTDNGGTYEIGYIPAGHYGLLATKRGYYDNGVNFYINDGDEDKELNLKLKRIDSYLKLDGTVMNNTGVSVPNATVTLILENKSTIYSIYKITNAGGYFSTNTSQNGSYEFLDLFAGEFKLKVSAPDHFTNISVVNLTGDRTLNISLDKTAFPYVVRGYIFYDKKPVKNSNSIVFLYDKNKGRIIANNSTGSTYYFGIPAYNGEFLLIVKSGYKQYFKDVSVMNANVSLDINIEEAYASESRETKIDFMDWQNVFVNESRKLTPNSVIGRLTNIENPRLQIDIDFGNGDGYLDESEVKNFTDSLNTTGPKYNDSRRLFTVDSVNYNLVDYYVNLQNAAGLDASNQSMYLNTTMKFSASTINTSKTEYNFTITERVISQVIFPSSYESKVLQDITSMIGYTVLIGINVPPTAVNFSVPDIVANNTNVTFMDMGSSDIPPRPLNFTWIFNDTYFNATNPDTTYGYIVTHLFTTPGYYNVTLIVNDTAGGSSSITRQILVDGTPPTSVFNATGENQTIMFDATDSQDNSTTFDGGIGYYNWFFDDVYSEQNYYNGTDSIVNHTYVYPGLYNVTLTVVDKAGNKATSTLRINASDKTPPSTLGKIIVENKTGDVINIEEGNNLTFTAEVFDEYYADGILSNATSNKNASIQRIAYYNWSFGDDKYDSGINRTTTHTYDKGAIDEYHPIVSVNVTDIYGNSATFNLTTPLIEISPKNISKITILDGSLKLSDDAPTKNQLIKINATISNVGRRYAENITIEFYVDTIKINFQSISNISAKDETNNTRVVTVDWVVNVEPGRHIIKAVVVDPNNVSKYVVYSGEQNRTLNVRQQEIPRDLYIYSGFIIFLVIIIGVYILNKKKRDKLTTEEEKEKKKIGPKKPIPKPVKKR